jgi:hypothetical protein
MRIFSRFIAMRPIPKLVCFEKAPWVLFGSANF